MVLANNFTTELPSHWDELMHKKKQEWNPKQQGICNNHAIVDRYNYNCCPDLELNDMLSVISLLPHFFFIAVFGKMQLFPTLTVIKIVICYHVMKFELLIMQHYHLHNLLSSVRLPVYSCNFIIWQYFDKREVASLTNPKTFDSWQFSLMFHTTSHKHAGCCLLQNEFSLISYTYVF